MRARNALVLYVHGARDPRWAEPFERLRERISRDAPELDVALAFLEHQAPDLATLCAGMSARGIERIRIVPMFFGRGGHLRDDFPRQLEAARRAAPNVRFELTQAAGESDDVQAALARFALHAPAVGDESSSDA